MYTTIEQFKEQVHAPLLLDQARQNPLRTLALLLALRGLKMGNCKIVFNWPVWMYHVASTFSPINLMSMFMGSLQFGKCEWNYRGDTEYWM